MSWKTRSVRVSDLFRVKSGDYHATKELDPGDVPLISCGDTNNGLVGYFDIPSAKRYHHCLTVAYNGQPLLAKFHPYAFGAKDDVAVLVPLSRMEDMTLLYIASVINRMKWRYSYGRKCFRAKLSDLHIAVPMGTGDETINQVAIAEQLHISMRSILPRKQHGGSVPMAMFHWQSVKVTDLFDVTRGDFHSLSALDPGSYRTVSRVTQDDGTVGYHDIPERAKVYPKGVITVSTVGADAFVQLTGFIATDNVLVCTPKRPLRISTLFFITFALNNQRWRYSYGRQAYKTKFANTQIWLPTDGTGAIDEDSMEVFLTNTSYWPEITRQFPRLPRLQTKG